MLEVGFKPKMASQNRLVKVRFASHLYIMKLPYL